MKVEADVFYPLENRKTAQPLQPGEKSGLKTEDEARLKEAVSQFTALLFQQMFKAMRGTVPGGLFKDSFASQVYQDFFDTEVSRMGAEQNYFKALNQQLYQQLNAGSKQQQEKDG